MHLVGNALGWLISVAQVAKDLNHVFGSPDGLDVNPFRMVLPIAPGKSCELNRSMQHHLIQIFLPKVVFMTQGKRFGLSAAQKSDISPDHSQLLVANFVGNEPTEFWALPLPSGPPRRIADVTGYAGK